MHLANAKGGFARLASLLLTSLPWIARPARRGARAKGERCRREMCRTYPVSFTALVLLTTAIPGSATGGTDRTCATEIAVSEPVPCAGLRGKQRRACCNDICRVQQRARR